ncbi:MAG: hypothetical protein WDA16_10120 [Candidatus Thermoplasmatota archaeon]
MRSTLPLALLALLVLPIIDAQTSPRIDVRIELPAGTATGDGVVAGASTPNESYAFTLNLTRDYTTIEVHARGFIIERARQLVPHLLLDAREGACARAPGACDYTIFEEFPNDQVWTVDSPARVFFTSGTRDDVVLRLGVPGPVNATLLLVRDVTPPTFVVGERTDFTTYGFYQESQTNELAIGDLQVRELGKTEWVVNPTPIYHVRQRFPVQGLSPERTYETRFEFHDWAGNNVTSPIERVTMPPAPVRASVTVKPLAPSPNATITGPNVVVRAEWSSPDSPVERSGVRLFFDLKEVTSALVIMENTASFTPPATLGRGAHRVDFEVTNQDGGEGSARWSFTVGRASVGLAPWLVIGALALAGTFARGR